MSGDPAWPVSSPMVICGSRRRSLENPGSRYPSSASVPEYRAAGLADQLDDPGQHELAEHLVAARSVIEAWNVIGPLSASCR